MRGCTSLISISIATGNSGYLSDSNGVMYNKDKTTLIQYPLGKEDKEYSIPIDVTTLKDKSFYGSVNLQEITIPNNVLTIENNPFIYSKSLNKFITNDDHTKFSVDDGILFNKDGNELLCYPMNKEGEYYFISDKVIAIGIDAFTGNIKLKTII